jgi:hypothetical protein
MVKISVNYCFDKRNICIFVMQLFVKKEKNNRFGTKFDMYVIKT